MPAAGRITTSMKRTVGYWYRLFGGEYGRIEQGNQVVYIHRNLWSGIGRTPQGGDIVAYTRSASICLSFARWECAACSRAPMVLLQWVTQSAECGRKDNSL